MRSLSCPGRSSSTPHSSSPSSSTSWLAASSSDSSLLSLLASEEWKIKHLISNNKSSTNFITSSCFQSFILSFKGGNDRDSHEEYPEIPEIIPDLGYSDKVDHGVLEEHSEQDDDMMLHLNEIDIDDPQKRVKKKKKKRRKSFIYQNILNRKAAANIRDWYVRKWENVFHKTNWWYLIFLLKIFDT